MNSKPQPFIGKSFITFPSPLWRETRAETPGFCGAASCAGLPAPIGRAALQQSCKVPEVKLCISTSQPRRGTERGWTEFLHTHSCRQNTMKSLCLFSFTYPVNSVQSSLQSKRSEHTRINQKCVFIISDFI